MSKYIIRLDDACEKRDVTKWNRIEFILDKYAIKPLVGIIPKCEDPTMESYEVDVDFWDRVIEWHNKGWTIALHGFNHVYTTFCGGINPVNKRSEFAGVSLADQKEKITNGMLIMEQHGVFPKVFFAPSHTFDENTIIALKDCSDIRIISDTVANAPYTKEGITFVPQQSGRVRKLPFRTVTFCYHPNTMTEEMYDDLERFIEKNKNKFVPFPTIPTKRKKSIFDIILEKVYFARR